MAVHLIRKLEQFTRLSREEKRQLELASGGEVRRYRARDDIVREGDRRGRALLLLEGWACRYKTLEDGRRQIMSLLLPGDICDPDAALLRQADHSIGALTAVELGELAAEQMQEMVVLSPRIDAALRWDGLVSAATQREWTVNLGQRTAQERLSHLLCELFLRLQAVGLTKADGCEFPITQADLGDTLGLSTVHVNRTLQDLRSSGMIVLGEKWLTIPDLEALMGIALFSDTYLHREREGRSLDANES